MRTCREVVEPLRAILIRVPPTGVAGVCRVCHGAPNPGHAVCESCSLTRRQVSKPIELVVPISFSTRPSQLHQVLTDYKSSPHPDVRRELSQQVICLLAHFLGTHASCIRGIAGRSWTAVTVVPSSIDRAGPHPLE